MSGLRTRLLRVLGRAVEEGDLSRDEASALFDAADLPDAEPDCEADR